MIACVVLCHHQNHAPMLNATETYGDYRVLVIDRSHEVASQDWPNVIRNEAGHGFLAGRMRQLGLDTALNLWPNLDGVVWFDGDRVPNKCIDGSDCAVLYRAESDPRHELPENITEQCKHPYSPFYTCGFYLPRKIIDALGGVVNDPDFDGQWGFEDLYLGDRIASLGFDIVLSKDLIVSGVLLEPDWVASADTSPKDERFRNWYLRLEKRKTLKGLIMADEVLKQAKEQIASISMSDLNNLIVMIQNLPYRQAVPMLELIEKKVRVEGGIPS